MDATCKTCGNSAQIEATAGGGLPCAACVKRADRRRLIFDVGERPTSAPATKAAGDEGRSAASSPPEETRMLDLLSLARRSQERLATLPRLETLEVPLSVREAILLVDSIAPASIEPAPVDVAPAPPGEPTSPSPTRRRLHAVYSGAGLLVVMAVLVVVKAQMGQEVASAAGIVASVDEATAMLLATPATAPSPVIAAPTPTPAVTVAPTAAPRRAPTPTPPRPAPTHPKATAADAPEARASADPTATPHVDLLGAMAAAVAAHSAPPSAPRAAMPGEPKAPSPSAPGAARTSPLRP